MKIYDTLIVGSGYFATGYAAANGDAIICEEHQICDTGFYLPLRSFRYAPYTPKTEEGVRLFEIFNSVGLFSESEQNTNGFEAALCQYILEKKVNILLKCRVISTERTDSGVYDVTVQTNEGLSHIFARKILSTVPDVQSRRLTVLFVSDNIENDKARLLSAFSGAKIESAFYKGRYALHIDAPKIDENRVKLAVYEKWRELDTGAKILYIAPVFYDEECKRETCDFSYENPVAAFETGYLHAEGVEK